MDGRYYTDIIERGDTTNPTGLKVSCLINCIWSDCVWERGCNKPGCNGVGFFSLKCSRPESQVEIQAKNIKDNFPIVLLKKKLATWKEKENLNS